ncbi:MAG: tRNA uridine-5-carboxymethylaminomethyl(34) synthesis GTPase MnmE [Clostridiales bacterium]|nr:tRNA uridine-5-carboxymethylaminomethyl(34) synthesis GTPase MnmE [Clostridiales bacterium]
MFFEDTIAAIATPPGKGGIGIVRISGERALEIGKKIFVFPEGKKTDFKNRYLHYGWAIDEDNILIDEVLFSYMQAPHSYTAEDVVEVHCHGGIIPLTKILKTIISKGARLAQPGEFTKRAFINGRIDLVQAEAVMDLINAESDRLARISLSQIEGGLSVRIRDMRGRLLNLMARIEVTIDYPEEDIDEMITKDIKNEVDDIVKSIQHLLKTAKQGKLIRQGVKAVIIGRTNVGKSSLLNALTKEDRAIVTEIPGTTRDTIEDMINIRGIPVRIVDTAGIRETIDKIEKIGIERSKENIITADLLITVLDASEELTSEDLEVLTYIKDKKAIVILNKTDKPNLLTEKYVKEKLGFDVPVAHTSLTLGQGIEIVEDMIYNMFFEGDIRIGDDIMITNLRHQEALMGAENSLMGVVDGLNKQMPPDIIAIDIRDALDSLGAITGESVTDDLIDKIFSEFCLGK